MFITWVKFLVNEFSNGEKTFSTTELLVNMIDDSPPLQKMYFDWGPRTEPLVKKEFIQNDDDGLSLTPYQ